MIRILRTVCTRAVALAWPSRCLPALATAQVATGSIVVSRRCERADRARRAGHDPQCRSQHVDVNRDRRQRRLFGAVSRAGHLRSAGRVTGIQGLAARRSRAAGERSAAHRRGARSRRARGATTVQASAPVVSSDSSEVGTVIEETAIKELPLNGRNFATLVYLVPGITPGQANENLSGASAFNPRGAATSTRSAIKRTRTAGSSTASTTTSSPSTP